MKDEAICPHCGHQESNSWEIGSGQEGEFEFTCNSCGLDYFVRRYVSVRRYASITYTSTPK